MFVKYYNNKRNDGKYVPTFNIFELRQKTKIFRKHFSFNIQFSKNLNFK